MVEHVITKDKKKKKKTMARDKNAHMGGVGEGHKMPVKHMYYCSFWFPY